jgi:hypothetical protein
MDVTEIGYELDSSGSGHGPVADSNEHSYETSGLTKHRKFQQLSNYQLLKTTRMHAHTQGGG